MSQHSPRPWKATCLPAPHGTAPTVDVKDARGKTVIHWAGFDSCDQPKSAWAENAHDIVQAVNSHAALVTACTGTDPDSSRLDWLSALLSALREENYAVTTEDPDATLTALRECEALLDALRAALALAGEREVGS